MLFKHKPVLQYIGLSVCMGFILMAMKRGAIIIGALTVVYFLWMNLKLASKKLNSAFWLFQSSSAYLDTTQSYTCLILVIILMLGFRTRLMAMIATEALCTHNCGMHSAMMPI